MKISISRAWEETKAVIAREGRLLTAVALALLVLPGIVISTVGPAERPVADLERGGPWMLVTLVGLVISLAGQLAVIRLAMAPHVSVGEAISHGFRRLLPYLGSVLIWMLPIIAVLSVAFMTGEDASVGTKAAVGLLGLVAIIVLMFISVRLLLSSSVATAEEGGSLAILRRSWHLTAGNWWRLFAFLILFVIGAGALLVAVSSIAALIGKTLLGGIEPMTVGGLFAAIISQLVSAMISIVFFVMLARMYVQVAQREDVQACAPSSGI